MKIKYLLAVILGAALLCGCEGKTGQVAEKDEEFSKIVFAMDTEMSLKAYGEHAAEAIDKAEQEINRLDKLFDRGNEKSDIYRINSEGFADVSGDTAKLTMRALEICKETDGVFDITIAPVMDLWGFYTKEFHVPVEDEIPEALECVDYNNAAVDGNTVTVSNSAQIDLGGIAKGYLSARIMDIFEENGVKSGIVSLGGNVEALGEKPDGSAWRVAIQDPADPDEYIGSVSIRDMAVITSGGYQRYFEENGTVYHHIIDPRTGYPAHSGVSSVSIISSDGTMADGLSTSLFVMGLDNGTEYWREHDGFDVIFVTDDGMIYITEGLGDIFKTNRKYTVIKR